MRNQNVVDVGEHIADPIVPPLHVLVETEVFHSGNTSVAYRNTYGRRRYDAILDFTHAQRQPDRGIPSKMIELAMNPYPGLDGVKL
jgi:hypothetical protein